MLTYWHLFNHRLIIYLFHHHGSLSPSFNSMEHWKGCKSVPMLRKGISKFFVLLFISINSLLVQRVLFFVFEKSSNHRNFRSEVIKFTEYFPLFFCSIMYL